MEKENNKPIDGQVDIDEILNISEEPSELELLKADNATLMEQDQMLRTKLTNAETEIARLNKVIEDQQRDFLIKLGKMAYNMFD